MRRYRIGALVWLLFALLLSFTSAAIIRGGMLAYSSDESSPLSLRQRESTLVAPSLVLAQFYFASSPVGAARPSQYNLNLHAVTLRMYFFIFSNFMGFVYYFVPFCAISLLFTFWLRFVKLYLPSDSYQ